MTLALMTAWIDAPNEIPATVKGSEAQVQAPPFPAAPPPGHVSTADPAKPSAAQPRCRASLTSQPPALPTATPMTSPADSLLAGDT